MIEAMIFLTCCIIVLVMLAIFYSLWDIVRGRWTEKQHNENEIEDQEDFDNS